MASLLFITTGLYFDPSDSLTRLRYETMSKAGHAGHILSVVYDKKLKSQNIDNFNTVSLYLPGFLQGYGPIRGVIRAFYYAFFCLLYGIFNRQKYDICIASDTFKTGTIALLIHFFTGKPFIVEVAGNYARSFLVNSSGASLLDRFKQSYVKRISPIAVKYASAVKLLYETQLDELLGPYDKSKNYVFHDITDLDAFQASSKDEKFILSAGHPWYLKGMDLLIKAFLRIQSDHPEYKLVLVGYCPDPSEFIEIYKENPNIVLHSNGLPFNEVVQLMARCSMFVLASRTEAMGRVLLEAMASRKPIIASRIDGIPRIVKDQENGLLFEPENIDELTEKMSQILNNPTLANKLASHGHNDINDKFSIDIYIHCYNEMINAVLTR